MTGNRRRARGWAQRQGRDPWVRKARAQGLASRAAFKLEEVSARFGLLRPGQVVLELGAAPGSWTALAAQAVGPGGRVVAVDRLPMKAPKGVVVLEGDLEDCTVRAQVLAALGGPADIVLCDIAPNLTGIRDVDEANQARLAQTVADMAAEALKPGGGLLVKAFEGAGSARLRERLRQEYGRVRRLKPAASRARSSEFYLLAQEFRGE